MKLSDLKFPVILAASFFAFNQVRRALGIDIPQWLSVVSVIVVVVGLFVFVIYGRKRERLSSEYLAQRDNAPKFEDDIHRSSFEISKADK